MRIDFTTYEFWDGKEWISGHAWGSTISSTGPLTIRNIKYFSGRDMAADMYGENSKCDACCRRKVVGWIEKYRQELSAADQEQG